MSDAGVIHRTIKIPQTGGFMRLDRAEYEHLVTRSGVRLTDLFPQSIYALFYDGEIDDVSPTFTVFMEMAGWKDEVGMQGEPFRKPSQPENVKE